MQHFLTQDLFIFAVLAGANRARFFPNFLEAFWVSDRNQRWSAGKATELTFLCPSLEYNEKDCGIDQGDSKGDNEVEVPLRW